MTGKPDPTSGEDTKPAPATDAQPSSRIDAWKGGVEIAALIIALIVGSALLILGVLLLHRATRTETDALSFRRHWGGFGGEVSGWQMSRSLANCVGGVALLVIGSSIAIAPVVALRGTPDKQEASAPQQPSTSTPRTPSTSQQPNAGTKPARPLTAEQPS